MNIEEIADIKMIHIYDLTGSARPDEKYGVTSVLVNYGDNTQLNYSENDFCFSLFVNKLFEAYNTAQDKSSIIMDDTTREIMEAGEVPRHESILSKYYDSEKLSEPVLVNASTLSKRFAPLVEYLVVGLYKTMGTEVEVIDRKSGWRGAGRLIIRVGDSNRTIFFKAFEINDSTFSIRLNGFLSLNGDLLINVILYDDSISISYKSEATFIEGSTSFKFSKENLREMHQIQKDGEQIFYDVNTYENTFSEDSNLEDNLSVLHLGLLPRDLKPCAMYKLPMGLTFIMYDAVEANEHVEVQTFCGAFLWQEASCADLRGWTVIKSLQSGLSLKNEAFRILNLSDNKEKIQTSFFTGTGSRYKEELEGKYIISSLL
ncbi:MAG TPA: hypothetical protein DEO83_06555 [Lachnospiraceae bacterium]|nr:hypothetical protein [Lachnospiraceae bacterium]